MCVRLCNVKPPQQNTSQHQPCAYLLGYIFTPIQERRNSSVLAMKLFPSCTNSSTWRIKIMWKSRCIHFWCIFMLGRRGCAYIGYMDCSELLTLLTNAYLLTVITATPTHWTEVPTHATTHRRLTFFSIFPWLRGKLMYALDVIVKQTWKSVDLLLLRVVLCDMWSSYG